MRNGKMRVNVVLIVGAFRLLPGVAEQSANIRGNGLLAKEAMLRLSEIL